jgi:hypothetical protein
MPKPVTDAIAPATMAAIESASVSPLISKRSCYHRDFREA